MEILFEENTGTEYAAVINGGDGCGIGVLAESGYLPIGIALFAEYAKSIDDIRGCDIMYMDIDSAYELIQILNTAIARASDLASPKFNQEAIKFAIDYNRPITFAYDKEGSDMQREVRSIVPHKIEGPPAAQRVVGHDQDCDDIRSFRLDRISGDVQIS